MRLLVAGTVAAVASAGVVSPVEEKLFTDFQGMSIFIQLIVEFA